MFSILRFDQQSLTIMRYGTIMQKSYVLEQAHKAGIIKQTAFRQSNLGYFLKLVFILIVNFITL